MLSNHMKFVGFIAYNLRQSFRLFRVISATDTKQMLVGYAFILSGRIWIISFILVLTLCIVGHCCHSYCWCPGLGGGF
jgi:hypothetical protein